jgi:hypothetical protein
LFVPSDLKPGSECHEEASETVGDLDVRIDELSVPGIGIRRSLLCGLIAIALIMSFRTFQFFPGMFYVQETWCAACFLLALFVYPFWKMRTGLRFTQLELYLLLLMIADPVLAAWRTNQIFGQPLIYGILSQREIVLIAALPILANMLRRETVKLADLESVLLYLTWGTFALYSGARLLLKPSSFSAYGEGLVTHPMAGAEPSFKFQPYFLVFGMFYYAIQGIRTERRRYYLAAAILFVAALGGNGRGLVVSAVATFIFFLYRLRGLRRATLMVLKSVSIAALLGAAIFAINPERLSARIAGFSDAFAVVVAGSTTKDSSANARLFETLAALPYIQAHPFLGNGVISHQWQGGSEMAMGEYFFASDIGIIGIVFSFGILGLLLYAYQYRIAWLAVMRLPNSLHNPLLDATRAFLMFSAIYSLETGLCVWDACSTLFFVTLLDGVAARVFTLNFHDNRKLEKCLVQKPALSA